MRGLRRLAADAYLFPACLGHGVTVQSSLGPGVTVQHKAVSAAEHYSLPEFVRCGTLLLHTYM